MKKLILFVTIIAVVFSMASCKIFGTFDITVTEDSSTDTTSTEDIVGESSNGITPDDNVVEFPFFNDNSSEAEAVGGDESQIEDTSSASTDTTSSGATSSTESATEPSNPSSATSSEQGGDNEEQFGDGWGTTSSSESSSSSSTSSSASSDTSEETSSSITSSKDNGVEDDNFGEEDWETSSEDPDGPGWIDGWY